MPYLKYHEKETVIDNGGLQLEDYYAKLSAQDFAGHINYLNFFLVKQWIKKNGKRYWIFALFIGTLVCCVLEIYRRLVANYEDDAIKRNGDVE